MYDPQKSCRICKSAKNVEIDLKSNRFYEIFLSITKMKPDEEIIFNKICMDCYSFLGNMKEFFVQCQKSHQFFKELEQNLSQLEEPIIDEPDDSDFNFISIKSEKIEQDEQSNDDWMLEPEIKIESEPKQQNKKKKKKRPNKELCFQCDMCQRVFHRKDYLVDHLQTHIAKKLQCTICSNWYKGVNCLKIHLRKAHGILYGSERKNMLKSAEADGQEYVELDSEEKKKEKAKRRIELQRKNLQLFGCKHCDSVFKRKDSLASHIKTAHDPGSIYTCDKCGKSFRGRRCMLRHMKNIHLKEHVPSTRKCYICLTVFDTAELLKIHRKEVHKKDESMDSNAQTKVPCHICGNLYNRKTIESHIKLHSATRDYQCDKCSVSFHVEKSLLAHQARVHVEGRPVTCEICLRTYKHKIDLARHMKYHDEKKETYKCMECDMVFEYKFSYRRHVKLHEGRKPFQCDKCEKTFASNQNLKQHSYSHTGLRPHYCDVCNKGFYTRKAANEHKQQVHLGVIETKSELNVNF